MSPRNGILVGTRRRTVAPVSRGAAWCACFVIALTFACRGAAVAAPVGEQALRDADVRKAEKVLTQLRLLHDAANSDDEVAYRKLASKLFPELFVKVAEMPSGDLSTDLSTAVFLAEKLGRIWVAAGAATAECRGERPDIYLPLCLGLRGGTVRQLLLAKSRLHARWAAAMLSSHGGETDSETARSLAEMNAARANDLLIAERIAETLQEMGGRLPSSTAGGRRAERFDAAAVAAGSDVSDGEFADALHTASALLGWMPRSQTFYHLSNAKQAYADGLSWSRKMRQSKRLVVSASNGFQPDPLKGLKLDAEQVGATVQANWMSAMRFTRLAEQSLARPAR